ncbi:MAG: hypothetical protein HYV03_00645, partial [Deltaproteobacteria bacterium]|nr:hypothetical protein [Deltaproteobacteria bacterium]
MSLPALQFFGVRPMLPAPSAPASTPVRPPAIPSAPSVAAFAILVGLEVNAAVGLWRRQSPFVPRPASKRDLAGRSDAELRLWEWISRFQATAGPLSRQSLCVNLSTGECVEAPRCDQFIGALVLYGLWTTGDATSCRDRAGEQARQIRQEMERREAERLDRVRREQNGEPLAVRDEVVDGAPDGMTSTPAAGPQPVVRFAASVGGMGEGS